MSTSVNFDLSKLEQAGLLRGARLLSIDELVRYSSRGIVQAAEGQAVIRDREVTLWVGVDGRFPLSLPRVFLQPWDALGFLPHVSLDGDICYTDPNGLLLDMDNPGGILQWALEQAIHVLEYGLSGANHGDFIDEFNSYWAWTAKKGIRSLVEASGDLREVTVLRQQQDDIFVVDNPAQLTQYYNGNAAAGKSLTHRTALFIPLKQGASITPPTPQRPWDLEEVRHVVRENVTAQDHQRLKKLGRRSKWEEFVLLALPRPSGGVILSGIRFQGVSGGHPLLTGAVAEPLEGVVVQRLDRPYLAPRGGAHKGLETKRALLIGCGAVGGHIALILSQLGIGHITLVDPDDLQPENTYRHVLGHSGIGKKKAVALKTEIERKFPFITVDARGSRIEDDLATESIDLSTYQLVVSAAGDATLDLHLNRILWERKTAAITVFTWLEPFGIGGHALLTHPGTTPGCYRCLYADEQRPLYNRASFADEGQIFTRDDLGCGTRYSPYSALDALQTAQLACRLAVDGLLGSEGRSPLLSWKGPADAFESAGFRLSSRHALTVDGLEKVKYDYVKEECPICGRSKV